MSEFITLAEAILKTTTYQQRRTDLDHPNLPEDTLPICETFDKDDVEKLLAQPNCNGLRAYLGLDENDKVILVLVGVNENDEDIYLGVDTLLNRAIRCPSMCPPSSPLNS